jgi:hypothetical protein
VGEELVITIEGDEDRDDELLIVGDEEKYPVEKDRRQNKKGKNMMRKAYK